MARVSAGAWRRVRGVASDLGILAGAAAVTFGCWQWHPPSGYIVGGLWAIVLSYLLGGEGVTRDSSGSGA